MNKKLLVVALASAFAAPAAMADVTLSGTFNPAVVMTNVGSTSGATNPLGGAIAANPGGTTSGVTSQYSNFTISSVEDLGDGNKATAMLQVRSPQGALQTQGNQTLNSFRFHVGLEGGWGSLKIGREFSPYTWLLINNDPHDGAMSLGASLQILGNIDNSLVYGFGSGAGGDQGNAAGQSSFFGVASNAIFYDSPNLGGFKVRASYALPGNQKVVGANSRNPSEISASIEYAPEEMPFFVSAAFSHRKDWLGTTDAYYNNATGVTGSTDTAAIIGGGLKFGGATIRAYFEQLSYKSDVGFGLSEIKRNAFWLNASYALETGVLGASLISAGDATGAVVGGGTYNGGGTGATSIGLSYFHDLSKQTKPFIVLNRLANKAAANYGTAGSQPIGNGVGSDHTVVMVGIKHSF
jgi:predicted porin